MKPLAYPYFIIYNHFNRKSHSLQDYSARLLTMYLFSLSAGGWLLFLEAVNLRILKHYWFSSKEGASLFAGLVIPDRDTLCTPILPVEILSKRDISAASMIS